jgi:tetratricopeptide (TPR) repeat protein
MLRINSFRLAIYTVLMTLIAVAVTGCAGQQGRAAEPTALQNAATALVGGDSNQAVTLYTDFLGTNPDSPKAAEAYVGRGNAYFKLEKYDLAENDYNAALSRTRDKAIKAQATMGLANAASAQERFGDAEKLYRQALGSFGGQVPQDEATYRLAIALARQGKWDEAAKDLESVQSQWPSGEYAKYAKAKLPAVKAKAFTVQVGAFNKEAQAQAAAKQLEAKGLPSRIDSIDNDGVTLYAVRSGSFQTWQEAAQQADKLKKAGFAVLRLP